MQRFAGELSVMKPRAPFWQGLIFAVFCSACSNGEDASGTSARIQRELDGLMSVAATSELAFDPERATRLGLSEAATGIDHGARLSERSQAAFERQRLTRFEMLNAFTRAPLPPESSAYGQHMRVLQAAYDSAVELGSRGHGDVHLGAAYPYAADHLRGAYADVPDLLLRSHTVNTVADAEDYLRRLASLPDRLDDEARRLAADAHAGHVPPRAVIERMKLRVQRLGAGPAETHRLVDMFGRLTLGVEGLSEADRTRYREKAISIMKTGVLPAYVHYHEELERLRASGLDEPGLWQVPGGDDWYIAKLKSVAGADASADALHAAGHADIEALTVELDAALIAAGFTQGSVGERLAVLARLPGQIQPQTPEGDLALVQRLGMFRDRATGRLPQIVPKPAETPVTIEPSPVYVDPPEPHATYLAAQAGNRAPALMQLPLSEGALWSDYTLASLVFRETVPGRHLQQVYADAHAKLPLMRKLVPDLAFTEGWSAYAGTLAAELGLYENDPLQEIGAMRARLLDAAYMVSDTGIHRMRWTREQGIDFLVSVTGEPRAMVEIEIDRQSAAPCEAVAAWTGRQRLLALRDLAVRQMGPRYNAAAFHDVILGGGPRPLDLVEQDVRRWAEATNG